MDNDKNSKLDATLRGKEGDYSNESSASSSRARNRTVMLTPEITGQVRARLAQETENPGSGSRESDSGFDSPRAALPPGNSGFSAPAPSAPAQGRPAAPASRQGGIIWSKETPVIGFLVSFDRNPNGEVFELRSGRIIVSSHGNEANTMVIDDETVSHMHAIMRVSPQGEIQVLDQLSEHGTKIKRVGSDDLQELSGEKAGVEHGDTVYFGSRSFRVCVVPRGEGE